METKTYLLKTKFDEVKNELVQVDPNTLTIQFKIMDKYSLIEIIGTKKGFTVEEFKHQIICNKEQMIKILPNINDQVEFADKPYNKDRVLIDQNIGVIFEEDQIKEPIMGLHGQLDLEDLISEKEGS